MTDFSLLPYTSTSATPILLNTHSLKKIPLLERAFQYQTMSSWFLFLKSSTHGSRLLVFKLVKERRQEHCRNARNPRKRKECSQPIPVQAIVGRKPPPRIVEQHQAFQNSTLRLHVSKLKREGNLLLILCVINSSASLHNDFVELDKMQVNIKGVEHDLRRIEQIYSRLYKCIRIIILLIFLQGCRELSNKNISQGAIRRMKAVGQKSSVTLFGMADNHNRVSDNVGYTLLQCDSNSVHPC